MPKPRTARSSLSAAATLIGLATIVGPPPADAAATIVVNSAASPSPTAPAACDGDGDGDGDGAVTINELITGVGIALGTLPTGACAAFENASGVVDIAQLVRGVANALGGCAPTG